MIGIVNRDSSFFEVSSFDLASQQRDLNSNILSLTLTEKIGQMPSGTLSFYDPDHVFSNIYRTGARLNISWGYKNGGANPLNIDQTKIFNPDEISGSIVRRGFEAYISSPTGGGDQSGKVVYNCNFTGIGFRGKRFVRTFKIGTQKSAISIVMLGMGINPANQIIDFEGADTGLSEKKVFIQDDTDFRFLTKLAARLKCIFYVGNNALGPVGVFIDSSKLRTPRLVKTLIGFGISGISNIIDYKGRINNVISYTWSNSESESGVGSNVKGEIINGKIVLRRYAAIQRSVITYRLNVGQIQKVYKDAARKGNAALLRVAVDLLSKRDFASIQHFFDPISQSTAPDGYGYRIKCKMVGNPLFVPTSLVNIQEGFPYFIGGTGVNFYNNAVTHTIDKSGYLMNVEIVDAFVLSPSGLPSF